MKPGRELGEFCCKSGWRGGRNKPPLRACRRRCAQRSPAGCAPPRRGKGARRDATEPAAPGAWVGAARLSRATPSGEPGPCRQKVFQTGSQAVSLWRSSRGMERGGAQTTPGFFPFRRAGGSFLRRLALSWGGWCHLWFYTSVSLGWKMGRGADPGGAYRDGPSPAPAPAQQRNLPQAFAAPWPD